MPDHPNPNGVWSFDADASMLRRRKVAGTDTIGDLRVTYEVPLGYESGNEVSVLGKVVDGQIEKLPELKSHM